MKGGPGLGRRAETYSAGDDEADGDPDTRVDRLVPVADQHSGGVELSWQDDDPVVPAEGKSSSARRFTAVSALLSTQDNNSPIVPPHGKGKGRRSEAAGQGDVTAGNLDVFGQFCRLFSRLMGPRTGKCAIISPRDTITE